MSEWRRTPLAIHQRRGAGGGVRAGGARERERSGQRSGEGRGQQRETASPMVLHCVVPVKRLRRTENVRWTFEGVSAPRECGQPSPLHAHRTPYGSRHFQKPTFELASLFASTLLSPQLVRTEGTDVYCRVVSINYHRSDVAVFCVRYLR